MGDTKVRARARLRIIDTLYYNNRALKELDYLTEYNLLGRLK
ncbi:unnamed protein product [marine sediment metagenome]|uniref:Uncharacterized protein n=1 Tax=marine sediment metagenome TaxID=412755 RepID=X1PB87_9ZZZZ